MRRRPLLVGGAALVTALVAAVVVVVATRDHGDPALDAAPDPTSATTAPVATSDPAATNDPAAPPDLTFVPRADVTREARDECLARAEILTLGPEDGTLRLGRQGEPLLPAGSTVDARQVVWVVVKGETGDTDFRYPVDVRRFDAQPGDDLCLVGGTVVSPYPDRSGPHADALGWERLWHRTTGMNFHTPRPTIVGSTLTRMGDGIGFQGTAADHWSVLGVRMVEVHDDCIEADEHTSGRIVDSLLDGCYSGIASRSEDVDGQPGPVVEIRGSLVRLQAMQAAFNPDKYGRPSHNQFFKWEDDAPRVVIEDSILRADQLPLWGNPFLVPPGTECHDATFVWGGEEPLGEQSEEFLRCFDDDGVAPLGERITTDVSVWDDAVAAWTAARPA